MSNHPKIRFFPLCDLHHSPMRRVMLPGAQSENTGSFHQCERRDCNRIFRDGHGYSDFIRGAFDPSRTASRICPSCRATLYLAEVDHIRKVETWDCAEIDCPYSEDSPSPSSR
jgi:hypothetical protein